MKSKFSFFFLLVLLLFDGASNASVISLSVHSKAICNPQKSEIRIHLQVKNNGDENAYNVQVSVKIGNEKKTSALFNSLPPKKRLKVNYSFPWLKKNPGRYFAQIMVNYTDNTQYPFSAPSILPLTWINARTPLVFCNLNNFYIGVSGKLPVKIQNLSKKPITIQFHLLLSKAMHPISCPSRISLGPYENKHILISIVNQAGTNKSFYPVYAILHYTQNGYRYGTFASSTMIVAKETFYKKYRFELLAGFLIFLFLGIIPAIKKVVSVKKDVSSQTLS